MNKLSYFKVCNIIIALLLFSASLLYAGTIPQVLNYNGHLTDENGKNVPDGKYDVEFNFYEMATGGTPVWSEKWDSSTSKVVTSKGFFKALLGTYTTIPENFFRNHPETYLGLKVGTDSEMFPRQRLASVAYAFTAPGGIPKRVIVMWSGAVDKIPDGWALCDGSNNTPDLRDRFIVGAGNKYNPKNTGGTDTVNISAHTHSGPNHNHSIGADGANHTHTFSGTTGNDNRSDSSSGGKKTVSEYLHQHSYSGTTSTANANHSHGGATGLGGTGQTGPAGSASIKIIPPYYALAFIMKL